MVSRRIKKVFACPKRMHRFAANGRGTSKAGNRLIQVFQKMRCV